MSNCCINKKSNYQNDNMTPPFINIKTQIFSMLLRVFLCNYIIHTALYPRLFLTVWYY